jgi:hypothetical protein
MIPRPAGGRTESMPFAAFLNWLAAARTGNQVEHATNGVVLEKAPLAEVATGETLEYRRRYPKRPGHPEDEHFSGEQLPLTLGTAGILEPKLLFIVFPLGNYSFPRCALFLD